VDDGCGGETDAGDEDDLREPEQADSEHLAREEERERTDGRQHHLDDTGRLLLRRFQSPAPEPV
jgi:hypothetical protein